MHPNPKGAGPSGVGNRCSVQPLGCHGRQRSLGGSGSEPRLAHPLGGPLPADQVGSPRRGVWSAAGLPRFPHHGLARHVRGGLDLSGLVPPPPPPGQVEKGRCRRSPRRPVMRASLRQVRPFAGRSMSPPRTGPFSPWVTRKKVAINLIVNFFAQGVGSVRYRVLQSGRRFVAVHMYVISNK